MTLRLVISAVGKGFGAENRRSATVGEVIPETHQQLTAAWKQLMGPRRLYL